MNQTKSPKEILKFFILAGIAFLLDRLLPLFFDFPSVLLTVLIFIFIINSDKDSPLAPLIVLAVVLDIFSGFSFGIVFLSIATMLVCINFVKNYIDLKRGGIFGEVIFILFILFVFDIIRTWMGSYFINADQFYYKNLLFIPSPGVIIAIFCQAFIMSWAFNRRWAKSGTKNNYA